MTKKENSLKDGLDAETFKNTFGNRLWRLNNLYRIQNEQGESVTFKMRESQLELFENMHYMNAILKARQLGKTTFIQLFMLDACLFNPDVQAGTIAHKLDAAKNIFATKIRYPYDRLPDVVKQYCHTTAETERSLRFSNGSSLFVDTSFRSGTNQYLHISEYGHICAHDPDRAEEVKTGALNTVQSGQIIFIESTAQGRHGHFYDICQTARNHYGDLSPLDFKFFFFPWWRDPKYAIEQQVPIPQSYQEYFDHLEKEGIELTDQQKGWYVKKAEQQGDAMKREFPSTPDEAFEQSLEGAYFARQLGTVRQKGQVCSIPHDPAYPVYTFWDLGTHDDTAIWFYQNKRGRHCFIDYYEASGEGLAHYVRKLNERGGSEPYNYGGHYLPHDADARVPGETTRTVADILRGLGLRNIWVGSKVKEKQNAIESARTVIPQCWFDEENCDKGLKCLEGYQKQWDDKHGVWRSQPLHNWASHGADAFLEFAMNQDRVGPSPRRKLKYRDANIV